MVDAFLLLSTSEKLYFYQKHDHQENLIKPVTPFAIMESFPVLEEIGKRLFNNLIT
jgi:hypothetical protein